MNKLRHWIRDWLTRDEDYRLSKGVGIPTNTYDSIGNDCINSNSIKFTVTPANGGVIITTYSFNAIKGENNNNIYVIHQNDEVSENITKIITLELLKKQ
jgi:hypothetical protein